MMKQTNLLYLGLVYWVELNISDVTEASVMPWLTSIFIMKQRFLL